MLWQDDTQQLVEISRLAANHRCQAHSLVQFKSERVPSRKGANALPCWEGLVPTSCKASWDREQPLQRFIELNPGGGGLVPILQALVSMLKSVSARPSAGIAFPTCGRQLHVAGNFRHSLVASHVRSKQQRHH